LLLPATDAGTYFLLVMARGLPGDAVSETVTLAADILGFQVTGISPDVGGQGQVTTTVTGGGFREGDRVFLRDGGRTAFGEILESASTERRVRFYLSDVPVGTYDLVVDRGEGSEETVLAEAFTVEPAVPLRTATAVHDPGAIRSDARGIFRVEVSNTGNVDIPYLAVSTFAPRTQVLHVRTVMMRSEERRVGKEGRTRWPA